MLHAKLQDHRTSGSGEEDFQGFYHIWAWRPSWSCDLDHLYKFSFPLPKEAQHKIWLRLVKRSSVNGRTCSVIKRLETELKWIKLLQSASPLGFNDNIYQEGNISKMPDFEVSSRLEIRKRKHRSHG